MALLRGKIDTSLKMLGLYCFKCMCSSIFGPMLFSTACFLINRMHSLVLNYDTPFHTLFPNKLLFPIEPRIFGCTCFVQDVRLQVSKLDSNSLKLFFLGYSRVQKGYRCYCPSLCKCLVVADVTFLEDVPSSQPLIHTN